MDLSLEEKVDRLSSVHEIRQLAYRHAYAIDSWDGELFKSLWAETDEPLEAPYADIHSARNPRIPADGRGPSAILVGNHLIEFDSNDEAHGTVYALVQIELGGKFIDQTVIYQDRYVRVDNRWLFLNRKHLLLYGTQREPNPFDAPAANWPASQVGRGVASEAIRKGAR